MLEKLILYEAVHTIESWDDLKNRLDSDKRCFAYFHPRMPEEPIIFVEVALMNGLADNIQMLLDQNAPVIDPQKADTAIFYSISNAQKGLTGISFGNFLIKRVVTQLTSEFKSVRTFATLSPIPGFMNWLEKAASENNLKLLNSSEERVIRKVTKKENENNAIHLIKSALKDHLWIENDSMAEILEKPVLKLVSHYLINEKGRKGYCLDPVANFHLTNGAVMERLNWKSDISENGLKRSAGIMINYLYDLTSIENNHEAYSGEKKITVSTQIKYFLKDGK